jgi:hypothetical protein
MALRPDEEVGAESHLGHDQFFRVEKGKGEVWIGGERTKIKRDDALIVPAGASHNIVNTDSKSLKLYTLYSPPQQYDGVVRATKADEAAEDLSMARQRNRTRPPNQRAPEGSMPNPAPDAEWARIADLHPTQITLGLHEVAHKRLRWRARLRRVSSVGAPRLIAPVVRGGDGRLYLVDRHHLLRAVQLEGVEAVLVRPIADFSEMSTMRFWEALDVNGWCHPYDAAGQRRSFREVPGAIDRLVEDPYRSLASALRRCGGFEKTPKPFSEFAWADYLRQRVGREVLANDFEAALCLPMVQAGTPTARDLPGWRPDPSAPSHIDAVTPAPHAAR